MDKFSKKTICRLVVTRRPVWVTIKVNGVLLPGTDTELPLPGLGGELRLLVGFPQILVPQGAKPKKLPWTMAMTVKSIS